MASISNKLYVQPFDHILSKLPYGKPFLFVDSLQSVTENGVEGQYTFPADSSFYAGHFSQMPVTPGVILTEVMAQIGVVCLGIFLLNDAPTDELEIALTATQIDFYKPVFPGETVTVRSTKDFFRFHKLKCRVEMLNDKDELVCRGTIAGMMKSKSHA
ncbi:3-hydroxyacyl-ACP dehydratase FabZ family protein [Spirosoma luteum]|uniref:3-hydroxyacyl-ACP dehydratase FabZ family protein n=1 Tax=Spirosoma luteum TaxID=431553 RepID=UPI0012F9B825|nr:hydroxymyristoyl-ACP dehydratase [Spirosoma luteum]